MKKLSKIAFAALAAVAMIVSATSCVQVHSKDEAMGDLTDQYVRGTMNNWGDDDIEDGALTKNDDGTYSFVFKATGEEEQFGVSDKSWSAKYAKGEVKAGGDYAVIEVGSGMENATITGLTAGEVYTMTIIAGAENIKVKVELGGELESTGYEALPVYLDGYWLVGEGTAWAFNGDNLIQGAVVDNKTLDVNYVIDLQAPAGKTEMEYALQKNGWSDKYCSDIVADATEETELEFHAKADKAKNSKITGVVGGEAYRMEIRVTTDGAVFVKVYKICTLKLSLVVKGLNDGDKVWVNGSVWGSDWPQGWPISDWGSKGAGLSEAVADESGVATFASAWDATVIAKPGEELEWEVKVVALPSTETDWAADGATCSTNTDNMKVSYKVTKSETKTLEIDLSTNKVSIK